MVSNKLLLAVIFLFLSALFVNADEPTLDSKVKDLQIKYEPWVDKSEKKAMTVPCENEANYYYNFAKERLELPNLDERELEQATKDLKRAVDLCENHFEATFKLADIYHRYNRNFKNAEKFYKKTAKLYENYGYESKKPYYHLGEIYWEKRKISEAIKSFEKALEGILPDSLRLNALKNLGELYLLEAISDEDDSNKNIRKSLANYVLHIEFCSPSERESFRQGNAKKLGESVDRTTREMGYQFAEIVVEYDDTKNPGKSFALTFLDAVRSSVPNWDRQSKKEANKQYGLMMWGKFGSGKEAQKLLEDICNDGDAESCLALSEILDLEGEVKKAKKYRTRACSLDSSLPICTPEAMDRRAGSVKSRVADYQKVSGNKIEKNLEKEKTIGYKVDFPKSEKQICLKPTSNHSEKIYAEAFIIVEEDSMFLTSSNNADTLHLELKFDIEPDSDFFYLAIKNESYRKTERYSYQIVHEESKKSSCQKKFERTAKIINDADKETNVEELYKLLLNLVKDGCLDYLAEEKREELLYMCFQAALVLDKKDEDGCGCWKQWRKNFPSNPQKRYYSEISTTSVICP